ncbi:hypothetical protein [Cupriavidus basilensis]|uniref:hypothetical protein n=1 Tax=Cupriavidus basilensis TaxID=68895 RepID=UPI00283C1532|nr:hypothetical protein [Cupriavidus basilensis]MDR3383416.1 hypothetical protein [Cupriavidus basilensis]
MFQTSSKPAQRRRGGAGSATAVVLLGAGLACAGQARADEGTGLEALDLHSASGPAGLAAAPAVPEQTANQTDNRTYNPYLAAALGSMAGRTPAQQEPVAAPLADHPAEVAPDPATDSSGALEAATGRSGPSEPSGPSDTKDIQAAPPPAAARADTVAWKPVADKDLQDLRGGFAAAARPAAEASGDPALAGPDAARAQAPAPQVHAARTTMASWKPVAQERLDDLRGGFDVGSGLQVSFGIERSVLINGALVVSTSLTIPDVSRITADQATRLAAALGIATGAGAAAATAVGNALASNPVTAGTSGANGSSAAGGSSSSTGTSASASGSAGTAVTSLPATAIAAAGAAVTTNGVLSLIQNGPGNSAAASMLAGAPVTVIQNTLNNQSIQNLVTINAGVNTLQAFRAQVANATLNNALLSAAGRH